MLGNAILSSLVIALVSAFAAAGLTTWFALLRFRKERWWDKKFESYAALIQALHDMAIGFDEEVEASAVGHVLSENSIQEHGKQYNSGRDELIRQLYIGEFLLHPSTISALRCLLRDLDSVSTVPDGTGYLTRSSP